MVGQGSDCSLAHFLTWPRAEPGYYEDGAFGIRIENVLFVRKVETPHTFGDTEYYGFEHVTWVPIQTKLIDTSIMSDKYAYGFRWPTFPF